MSNRFDLLIYVVNSYKSIEKNEIVENLIGF